MNRVDLALLITCSFSLIVAVPACGPVTGMTGGQSGGGTSGGEPTTGASGGTAGSVGTSGGSGTSGTTGGDLCPPIVPEVITTQFELSPLPPEGVNTWTCVVLSVAEADTNTTLALSCGGPPDVQEFTLNYGALVHVPSGLTEGEGVILSTGLDMPFWSNRWFALQQTVNRQPEFVAAGVSGDRLDPPGRSLGEFLGGAAELAVVDGLCPDEPGPCSAERRLAIDFTAGGGVTTRVLSPGDGLSGGLALLVETAVVRVPPIACEDLPDRWFELVIERQP